MRRVRGSSGRQVAAAVVVDVTAVADTAAGVTVASEEAAAVTSSQRHSRSHLSERSGVEGSRGIRFTVSPRDSSTSLGMTEAAGKYGQDWIRTSEGVKPADLQSAPFGHFGTYPLAGGVHISSRPIACNWHQLPEAVDSASPTV